MIRRSNVYKLVREGGTIIVAVIDQPQSERPGVNCMVIGGDHPSYPPGGYDLYIFLNDLTEDCRVKL